MSLARKKAICLYVHVDLWEVLDEESMEDVIEYYNSKDGGLRELINAIYHYQQATDLFSLKNRKSRARKDDVKFAILENMKEYCKEMIMEEYPGKDKVAMKKVERLEAAIDAIDRAMEALGQYDTLRSIDVKEIKP